MYLKRGLKNARYQPLNRDAKNLIGHLKNTNNFKKRATFLDTFVDDLFKMGIRKIGSHKIVPPIISKINLLRIKG